MDDRSEPASSAAADPSALDALTALAQVIAANPAEVARLESACSAQLHAAATSLEASGQPRLLPLISETKLTVDLLAGNLGSNGCAAVAAAMELVARAMRTTPAPAREMVAVAELRSVRGATPPWRSPLIESEAQPPPPSGVSAAADPKAIATRLAAYRKSLLKLLKTDPVAEAGRLAECCAAVAAACGEPSEGARWRAAAEFFSAAATSDEAGRPLVKRLAVKLEQSMRRLCEGAAVEQQSRDETIEDLVILAALFRCGEDSALPLKVNSTALEQALEQLAASPPDGAELLNQIGDAFLIAGDYARWLEGWRLRDAPEDADALRAAVSRWSLHPGELDASTEVSSRFEGARAALGRIEAALDPVAEGNHGELARVSGIPVDRALLDNLNLMAREIRGARSRAEANLGSLRGGLVDMERTIRTLRSQLESLEVASYREDAGSGGEATEGSEGKFGALSRGIEELAGLKDALQALTEETESALADQAGDDTELAQGLLKTQMMPVGAQFEALCQKVQQAAAGLGMAATLTARGAEVALERSQVDALVQVLEPLLEACVREGLSANASPAPRDPGDGRLELSISQPSFDVHVEIAYRGAALTREMLSHLAPAINALGAVAASSVDAENRARVSLKVPGPPQPMDLLLVELGQSRLALPLKEVTGVSTFDPGASDTDGADGVVPFEGELYRLISLARALDLDFPGGERDACVLIARGGSRLALSVDKVVGRKRMLVRSPGPIPGSSPWVLGAVIDDLAAPTLVLDLGALVLEEASEPA